MTRAAPAPHADAGLLRAVAPVFIVFGVAVRVWLLANPTGGLDSDEAIVGLMARHILDGEFPMFYWGQTHGGPHEPLLTALFFQLFGATTLVMKVVAALLSAGACVLIWRVGRRTVGPAAGAAAALLFWVWPAAFVWWTVKSRGFYHVGLCIGLGILLLVLRLAERDSGWDMGLLGALVATGFWATPQTILFSVPALVWLAIRRFSVVKAAPVAIAGAIVGAFPFWVHNFDHDWVTFKSSPLSFLTPEYNSHLRGFFETGLPGALGLKLADGSRWVLGGASKAAYVLLLAAFVVGVVKLRGKVWLLLMVAAAYPFLFALSPYSAFVAHPRYLYFLGPILALLIARGVVALGWVAPVATLLVGLALTTSAFVTIRSEQLFEPDSEGVRIPRDVGPLVDYLVEKDLRHVYADYWLAYYVGFESGERIVAAPYRGIARHTGADAEVRADPDPAYLFLTGSPGEAAFSGEIAAAGVPYQRFEIPGFVVYALKQNVPPEAFPLTRGAFV